MPEPRTQPPPAGPGLILVTAVEAIGDWAAFALRAIGWAVRRRPGPGTFLPIMADGMGIVGGALICLNVYGIDPHHYWHHGRDFIGLWDVFTSLIKATVFGGFIALIACHRGFHSKAGAEGVGRAATEAFVASFVAILAIDFVLGMLSNGVHDMIWPPPSSGGL